MAWVAGFDSSFACEDPDNIRGIIFDALPAETPPKAIVLYVEFEPVAIEQWQDGPITAHIRRVVQGESEGDYVRVGLINSSCLYPFAFGAEGLIVGELRNGVRIVTVSARTWPEGTVRALEFRLGFEGSWFSPMSESLRERRERRSNPSN
ncbi:MAG: hypothetical protein ACT4OF_12725 [Caulobacteraceae bacterium]